MKKNYLFKLLLSVALLIGGCGCVMAQDGKAKAEELFRFLMDGKGDSVHVRLTEDIRSKIAPAVFSETPKQLEAQFGSFQSKGPWGTSTNGDMTLFSYEIFDAVARQGSFNKAAQQLHLTPSAISHAVAAMEEELGFTLFNRGKNGVTLTGSGEALYPAVRAVLNSNEALLQSVAQLSFSNHVAQHEAGLVEIVKL
jgi:molybdenum-dependent DNA-binding transcriptional regulator ModE